MKALLLALIRFYQSSISPWFPARCRFRPTCSAYAYEAISKYGPWKGGYLAIRRLLRCQPFYKGSFYDPVPPKRSRKSKKADKKVVYPPTGKAVRPGKQAEDNS